jgi:hypothetical protein
MRDDALAPVIAVMLILAAIVTFLSIWNAIYVPSLKESAEVDHLHNVETSFVHFSSDIDQAVSSHQDGLDFTEPVQLGGGDTMVNPLKSSGTLTVVQDRNTSRVGENTLYTITFYNSTSSVIGELNGTLVNFSYEPVNNFWQDQGYRWQFGYINVTKYGTLSTPYSYSTMDKVINETESGSLATFAKSFGAVYYSANRTNFPVYSTTIASLSPDYGKNLTTISISGSNFTGAINVTFGNTPVLCNGTATGCTVYNDTSITANSQEGTGTVDVIVYTSNGTETAQNAYTYGSSSSSSWYPTPVSYSPGSGNCSSLNVLAVNVTAAPDHSFSSSNGFGTLKLTSHQNSLSFNSPVTGISFMSDQEPFGNATVDNLNEAFSLANATCGNNIYYNATASRSTLHQYQYDIVQTESPINVTLTIDEISISAY